MKRIKFLILALLLVVGARAQQQLNIAPGTHWVTSGNASTVIDQLAFLNNGAFNSGLGTVKFTGPVPVGLAGSQNIQFNTLEISFSPNAFLQLNKNISIASGVTFISGSLDLNTYNISMGTNAIISGETETSRIIAPFGGFVEITRPLNAPNNTNPGGLGAFISSNTNLGNVTVRRGHLPQSGAGLTTSIYRYYSILPQNNANLNATLRLRYFDAELNAQNESTLVQYQSADGGSNWANQSASSRSTSSNFVEKTNLASLGLHTLANEVISGPVSGLTFGGSRKKTTEVQLNWTSQKETNLKQYELERKLDNEVDYSVRFVAPSQASGGNSNIPLSYKYTDLNSHTESSVYRLKIVDNNGGITYSNEITIAPKSAGGGGGKGKPNNNLILDETELESKANTLTMSREKTIKVGPNPNHGNFWFNLRGMEKTSSVTLYSIDGKILKQFKANNFERIQVTGLSRGIYMLKAEGLEPVKVVVQ